MASMAKAQTPAVAERPADNGLERGERDQDSQPNPGAGCDGDGDRMGEQWRRVDDREKRKQRRADGRCWGLGRAENRNPFRANSAFIKLTMRLCCDIVVKMRNRPLDASTCLRRHAPFCGN